MKNTMLLLTLLFSVNAFASNSLPVFIWSGKCLGGNCTMSEIEAENKENARRSAQHMLDMEEVEREMDRQFTREHQEAQARADAVPKDVYTPKGPVITCVQEVYEKATGILGDDATNHIDVSIISPGKCSFEVKEFGDFGRGCDNLAALSSIAKMGFYQEEQCRYEAESWKVYLQYKDVIYTPEWTNELNREYYEKLNPIQEKHFENVFKLQEQEKSLNKSSK
ncbi:hypothetical protein [Pseudomonas tolaasii]|uniref:hypothetical protein n=1 Tax=Pseudomonas tolaasii TaxID=29442 RepID=UPI0015A2BF86|nr:hypothetical protein [Pseudomonas tolaasii]NWC42580.1 hypothetical protein [Pseudomonas tolaasii]